MSSPLIAFGQKIADLFKNKTPGADQTQAVTSACGMFALEHQTFTQDDAHIILARATHQEASWCSVALRIVLREGQPPEISTGFSLDRINYALETDFAVFSQASEALLEGMEGAASELDLRGVVMADLAVSIQRVRDRWAENARNGHQVERFTINDRASRLQLMLAAPSTAMGSTEVFGVEQDYHTPDKFRRIWSSGTHPKHLRPVTQEALAKQTALSGHEKLQILSGEETPTLAAARQSFDKERFGYAYRDDKAVAVPGHDVSASDSVRRGQNGFYLSLVFKNGDCATIEATETQYKDRPPNRSFSIHHKMEELALNLGSHGGRSANPFALTGGQNTVTRIPSFAEMDLNFRTLFERILLLDPVWPHWVLDQCTVAFDPEHKALGGLKVPPRHQPVIATLLDKSYAKQTKKTERHIAKLTKKFNSEKAAADDPKSIADGMVYGDIKTGRLKAWENAKIVPHVRVYSVQTTSAPGDKRRKRALVPIGPASGMNHRPFTPKQIARLTRYEKPDALRLFPNIFLGHDKRDLYEAAYRVALEGLSGTENPLLQGQESIVEIDTDHPEFAVRWTEVEPTDGYGLTAFSVIQPRPPQRWGRPEIPTGAGFACLTTPKGDMLYLRPSFIGEKTHMPPQELTWLKAAIDHAYPFEPERAEYLRQTLTTDWDALAKTYPETGTLKETS